MTDTTHTTVAVALVLALVAAPIPPAVATHAPAPESGVGTPGVERDDTGPVATDREARGPTAPAGNDSTANLTVGESLSRAVVAHDAELEGEIEGRAFTTRLTTATFGSGGERARAAVVAAEVERARRRLSVLSARRERLHAARRNGSIGASRYHVAMARLTVETAALRGRLARAGHEADRLPADLLARRGLDREDIASLSARADSLAADRQDALLAAIADNATASDVFDATTPDAYDAPERPSITPDSIDWNVSVGTGSEVTTADEFATEVPDQPNGTRTTALLERRRALAAVERNRTALGRTRAMLAERADGDREVERALHCAREELDAAAAAIETAREALAASDRAAVDSALDDARGALAHARGCLRRARAELADDGGSGDDGGDEDGSSSTPTPDGSRETPTREGSWSAGY